LFQNEVTENNITNKETNFGKQTNKIDKRVDVINIDQNDNILGWLLRMDISIDQPKW
jgi:hypothetical protein